MTEYEGWTPDPHEDAAYVLAVYTLVDGRRFLDPRFDAWQYMALVKRACGIL